MCLGLNGSPSPSEAVLRPSSWWGLGSVYDWGVGQRLCDETDDDCCDAGKLGRV